MCNKSHGRKRNSLEKQGKNEAPWKETKEESKAGCYTSIQLVPSYYSLFHAACSRLFLCVSACSWSFHARCSSMVQLGPGCSPLFHLVPDCFSLFQIVSLRSSFCFASSYYAFFQLVPGCSRLFRVFFPICSISFTLIQCIPRCSTSYTLLHIVTTRCCSIPPLLQIMNREPCANLPLNREPGASFTDLVIGTTASLIVQPIAHCSIPEKRGPEDTAALRQASCVMYLRIDESYI